MRSMINPTLEYGVIGGTLVIGVLVSWWLNKVKREAPERIVGFLQRLGLYRYRG